MHKTLQQEEKQNLSVKGPSAQPWSTGYQSKITFTQSCRNKVFSYIQNAVTIMKLVSWNSGLFNNKITFQKTNYYEYRNTLFITKGYITNFLKTVLTEDTRTTTSMDLASWLPR